MRKAASMLELVIAIVVMGIAMMTLPLMLSRVQNNNNFAMQQEAILMARTQIGDIITYRWDEHSMDSSSNVGVLDTNSKNTNFERVAGTIRRIGHVKGNKRRKFFATETNASTIGLDSGETIPDDIDDFDDSNKSLSSASDTNHTAGYKLYDSNMSISVKYTDDNNSAPTFNFNQPPHVPTTNIKAITVSLKNSQLDGNLTLRAFSCNIGANQLLRKDFY